MTTEERKLFNAIHVSLTLLTFTIGMSHIRELLLVGEIGLMERLKSVNEEFLIHIKQGLRFRGFLLDLKYIHIRTWNWVLLQF